MSSPFFLSQKLLAILDYHTAVVIADTLTREVVACSLAMREGRGDVLNASGILLVEEYTIDGQGRTLLSNRDAVHACVGINSP